MTGDGHHLRIGEARQNARIVEAPPVSGIRKRSSAMSRSAVVPAKRSSSEAGRLAVSTGGMKLPLASCAKAPSLTNSSASSCVGPLLRQGATKRARWLNEPA